MKVTIIASAPGPEGSGTLLLSFSNGISGYFLTEAVKDMAIGAEVELTGDDWDLALSAIHMSLDGLLEKQ